MLMLLAVVVGLIAGLTRAIVYRRPLQPFELRLTWLVFIAFIPQLIAFALPTKTTFPDSLAPVALIISQAGLLVFAAANLNKPGFWLLSLGLALNLLVIVANGGLMPILPETAAAIYPTAPVGAITAGERLGTGRDIVLTLQQTRLAFLSDRFLVAYGLGHRAAFSLGDVGIALGTTAVLWTIGAPGRPIQTMKSVIDG
jgi:hypothetical protein